jgi:DNA polymerase III subunit epsilon
MFQFPTVLVDIETTGGSFRSSRIIEVAAIRYEGGEVTDQFQTLINPEVAIPYFITNMTGISNSDVASAPIFSEIAEQLEEIMQGAVFVAHNVRFDYSFLRHEFAAVGIDFKPKLLCTVRLSRALYAERKGHSLKVIIERHGIEVQDRHRALADATAMLRFVQIAHREHGEEVFAEAVSRQFKTQSLPVHLEKEKIEDISNKPGVYVFEDEAGNPVYVGKSVTLKKRIQSHFSSDVRASKEMKIAQNTHNVRVIETDNELEALLLESQMVKQLLPVYNQQLRRASAHAVILKGHDENGYFTLSHKTADLSMMDNLSSVYGVFQSRMKAKNKLEEIAKTYQLCPKLLGLEKTDRACFWYQLGKCKGACIGKEPAGLYNLRCEFALERSKIESWPYQTPIAIRFGQALKSLVVDQWMVRGYLYEDTDEPTFESITTQFDIDTYRILRKFVGSSSSKVHIRPISGSLLAS